MRVCVCDLQQPRKKKRYSTLQKRILPTLVVTAIPLGLLDLEDEGTTIVLNVRNQSPNDTVSLPQKNGRIHSYTHLHAFRLCARTLPLPLHNNSNMSPTNSFWIYDPCCMPRPSVLILHVEQCRQNAKECQGVEPPSAVT